MKANDVHQMAQLLDNEQRLKEQVDQPGFLRIAAWLKAAHDTCNTAASPRLKCRIAPVSSYIIGIITRVLYHASGLLLLSMAEKMSIFRSPFWPLRWSANLRPPAVPCPSQKPQTHLRLLPQQLPSQCKQVEPLFTPSLAVERCCYSSKSFVLRKPCMLSRYWDSCKCHTHVSVF